MGTGMEIMPAGMVHQAPPPQHSVGDLMQMAEFVGRSGLVKGVNTPASAFTLMLVCQARNEHPGNAIMRFHIIEGMPSMRADAMQAEFQARGGKVNWIRYDKGAAEAEFSHPRLQPTPVRITVELAELVDNGTAMRWDKDSRQHVLKDNYRKSPAAMLRARCISAGVKMVDPGAILGTYTPEEISDFIDVTPVERRPELVAPAAEPGELPSTRGEVNAAFQPAPIEAGQPGKIPVREKVKFGGDRYGMVGGEGGHDTRPWYRLAEEELGTANAAANNRREELGLDRKDGAAANVFQVTNKMFDRAIEEGIVDDPGDRKGLKPGAKTAALAEAYARERPARDALRRELKKYLKKKYEEACQVAENEAHGDAPGPAEEASQAPAVEPEDVPQAVPAGKGDAYEGP